ncbi:MAG TPA: oligosaccharide flippase family protein, partial [Pyrinomonadaceae bacterium]|nr:oligosaccharide flippase family protein [Pyrinomonadaceae bacterium]
VTPIEAGAFGSFASGVALTIVTRLLMLVGTVGASVIVARWLGPEGLGSLAVLNTTIVLTLAIGSLGLTSANTYFIAKDRKTLAPVWANAIVFALCGGTLVAITVVALAKIAPALFGGVSLDLIVIAVLSIPFQFLLSLGLNVLLAMDRIRQLNFMDAMAPALALFNAIAVLLLLRSNLKVLVSFNTAATVILSAVMLWVIGRLVSRQKERMRFHPDGELFKRAITYGLKFFIPLVAAILIFRVDLLIVNHFRGAAEAGVYAVASQVANLLTMLPGVIAMLLFPRVASYQDPRGEFAIQVTRHVSFVMLIMCVMVAAGSFLLPLIYGARFADATIQLLILLPGVCLIGIESVLVQHFTGTGLPVAIPVFWLITLAVSIGFNLALVPVFGARGAAVTSTISYALIFLFVAVYFCLKTGRRPVEIFLLRGRELRNLLVQARLASSTHAHE